MWRLPMKSSRVHLCHQVRFHLPSLNTTRATANTSLINGGVKCMHAASERSDAFYGQDLTQCADLFAVSTRFSILSKKGSACGTTRNKLVLDVTFQVEQVFSFRSGLS